MQRYFWNELFEFAPGTMNVQSAGTPLPISIPGKNNQPPLVQLEFTEPNTLPNWTAGRHRVEILGWVNRRNRQRGANARSIFHISIPVAIPSENPPGNHYEECARILFDELDRLGFDDVRREGACVLASAGTGTRTLYFSGHYDAVPAQSRDQFQPRVEGANLFGRGSSDLKSGNRPS
jgi:hypothetical protein